MSTGGFCGHSLSTVRNYQGNQGSAQGRYRSVFSTSSALAHVRCDGSGYSAARDRGAETSEVAEKYPVRNRHRCPACVLRMEMDYTYTAAGVDYYRQCNHVINRNFPHYIDLLDIYLGISVKMLLN